MKNIIISKYSRRRKRVGKCPFKSVLWIVLNTVGKKNRYNAIHGQRINVGSEPKPVPGRWLLVRITWTLYYASSLHSTIACGAINCGSCCGCSFSGCRSCDSVAGIVWVCEFGVININSWKLTEGSCSDVLVSGNRRKEEDHLQKKEKHERHMKK